MTQRDEAQAQKQAIRLLAHARRAGQPDPEATSEKITCRIVLLPPYAAARTLLAYVSFRSEVSTRGLLLRAWDDGKRLAVPYCVGDQLELFLLERLDELAPGTLGILEPKEGLRSLAARRVQPGELDLIVVPGLAFDPQCGRIGYGKGYYDRLLRQVPARTAVVGAAFQCQMFPQVPVLDHDVRLGWVVTESDVYQRAEGGRGKDE
jgi:5-formyltetrahydrofolate cyclo-ligase